MCDNDDGPPCCSPRWVQVTQAFYVPLAHFYFENASATGFWDGSSTDSCGLLNRSHPLRDTPLEMMPCVHCRCCKLNWSYRRPTRAGRNLQQFDSRNSRPPSPVDKTASVSRQRPHSGHNIRWLKRFGPACCCASHHTSRRPRNPVDRHGHTLDRRLRSNSDWRRI